jgi:hypothetical protein
VFFCQFLEVIDVLLLLRCSHKVLNVSGDRCLTGSINVVR